MVEGLGEVASLQGEEIIFKIRLTSPAVKMVSNERGVKGVVGALEADSGWETTPPLSSGATGTTGHFSAV